jgi:hypothetical protein
MPVTPGSAKEAELHVRADLGVVDAAERDLTPGTLAMAPGGGQPVVWAAGPGHPDLAAGEPA